MYFTFFNLILKYILRTCQAQNTRLIIGLSTVIGICNQELFFVFLNTIILNKMTVKCAHYNIKNNKVMTMRYK